MCLSCTRCFLIKVHNSDSQSQFKCTFQHKVKCQAQCDWLCYRNCLSYPLLHHCIPDLSYWLFFKWEILLLWILFSHCRYLCCWRDLYWWRKPGAHPSILGVGLVCLYHHTAQVPLTVTHTSPQCCSQCFTGRKQNEIVIYYLPTTWESVLGDLFVMT